MSSTATSMLLKLPVVLIKRGIGPRLDEKGLSAISQSCKRYRDLYKDLCVDRKKALELVRCILNIDKENKEKILKLLKELQEEIFSIIITRVPGKQVYFSQEKKQDVCMCEWTSVSGLESATLGGDFHLVRL